MTDRQIDGQTDRQTDRKTQKSWGKNNMSPNPKWDEGHNLGDARVGGLNANSNVFAD